jgi:phospholipid/cholesterol/gamma-HCH transport system substrate-binding protein
LNKVSKEFKIGLIFVLGIAVLIVGINFLKGVNLFEKQNSYYSVYKNVDGLAISNPVVLNGYKVGQVSKINFMSNGNGALLVAFTINENDLAIPSDSKARIISSDFFGSKDIELVFGESPVTANPGDTLISEIEIGLAEAVRIELKPLKNKTDQLIKGVDDILANLNAVFDSDATKGLPLAFESLQRTMETLEQTSLTLNLTVAENRTNLNSIFSNVEAITKNLKDHNEDLSDIMVNFSNISDSLAQINFAKTVTKIDHAMGDFAEAMEKVNNGEGTLGQLMNNDSLHTELLESNQELQYLINDLYMNPWRYVHVSIFGKKPKEKYSKKELEKLREMIDEQLESKDLSK